MTIPPLNEPDLLWLRDRAIGSVDLSIVIADVRVPGLPVVDVNPAFERMTGYTPADILGQTCAILQGPKTSRAAVNAMRDAIAAKRDFSTVLLNYRRDGTPFWNELHISPVWDQQGQLTHFVGVQKDVTEREKAAIQLKLTATVSEIIGGNASPGEMIRAMARAVVPGYADLCTVRLHSVDGSPRWDCTFGANPSLVTLTRALEAKHRDRAPWKAGSGDADGPLGHGIRLLTRSSRSMLDVVALDAEHRQSLDDLELCSALLVPIVAGETVFGSIELLRFDPEPPFSTAEVDVARDIAGRAAAVFEQARLLERAQTAIEARDRFLSIAAHELRTPVTSLKGYAQLLSRTIQQRSLTEERLRKAVRAIEVSVFRLSTLTDDMLGMSRRGSVDLPLRKRLIHVTSFLESILERSKPLHEHPIDFVPDLADAHVLGDTTMLEQVVFNLVGNAARYSPKCTPIEIATLTGSSHIVVSVSDAGLGLTPDEQERLFQPYGRAEAGEVSSLAGLGLGLYISKGIVERHGGRIWAESAGRNLGTTVRFALPLHPAPEL